MLPDIRQPDVIFDRKVGSERWIQVFLRANIFSYHYKRQLLYKMKGLALIFRNCFGWWEGGWLGFSYNGYVTSDFKLHFRQGNDPDAS